MWRPCGLFGAAQSWHRPDCEYVAPRHSAQRPSACRPRPAAHISQAVLPDSALAPFGNSHASQTPPNAEYRPLGHAQQPAEQGCWPAVQREHVW